MGQLRPYLSFIFGQTNIITIFICEKMSIQHTVPGFEPTTFRKSPPRTTRPGLPPTTPLFVSEPLKFIYPLFCFIASNLSFLVRAPTQQQQQQQQQQQPPRRGWTERNKKWTKKLLVKVLTKRGDRLFVPVRPDLEKFHHKFHPVVDVIKLYLEEI